MNPLRNAQSAADRKKHATAAQKIADDSIKVQLSPFSCHYDAFQFQFISYIDST